MAFLNRKAGTVVTGASVAAVTAWGETPTGATDGANATFTTASTVQGSAIDVYKNGAFQKAGGFDYTFTAPNQIVFASAPDEGSIIVVDYIKA